MMHQALLAGNAFAEIERNREGIELCPLPPSKVEGPELLPAAAPVQGDAAEREQ